MLDLFRRKMIFVEKYFQKKWFSQKHFSVFGSHEKNYEMQKSKSGKCRQNPAVSGRHWRIPASKFGQIRSDPGSFGLIQPASEHGQNLAILWPESGSSSSGEGGRCRWIPATGCCMTPVPTGFWRPTITEFRQSDIKCACKYEEFNFEKRFQNRKSFSKN